MFFLCVCVCVLCMCVCVWVHGCICVWCVHMFIVGVLRGGSVYHSGIPVCTQQWIGLLILAV